MAELFPFDVSNIGSYSGSFSGSFQGDGSKLTDISGGGSTNTGSLLTTSSFNAYTGSNTSQFAGTASFSQTASYVLKAVSSSFATTASYLNELQILPGNSLYLFYNY